MAVKKGKALMSYFRNRQGLRIRTYASEVDNPKGKVFLVHGIKSHFRGDFCGYNVDWHFNHIGEYKTETANLMHTFEQRLVFPHGYSGASRPNVSPVTGAELTYSGLDGLDVFEVTPRFTYEGSFVEYLNNLGYSTYGLDHQSHGLSESFNGKRCFFNQFDDVCYDLLQFITLVKRGNFYDTNQTYDESQVFPKDGEGDTDITTSNLYSSARSGAKERWYLMGLSMGGNVVLRSMELYSRRMGAENLLVDALFCFAGMINIDFHYQGVIKKCMPLFRLLNKMNPALQIAKPSDFTECLTMHMRGHDPLCFTGKMVLKMALMIYDATKVLDRDFSLYPKTLPTLFLHSAHDTVTDPEGPRYLMRRYFRDVPHVQFHELEGAAHVITSPLKTTVTGPLVKAFLQDLETKR